MWVCTRNGLNRYDGAKMNQYHHSDDPSSLSHDLTTSVLEFDADHILIGSENSLQSFSYATNSFTQVPIIAESGDTIKSHIVAINKFLNGEVHVCATGAHSYVIRKDEEGNLYAALTKDFTFNDVRPSSFLNTQGDEVWAINAARKVVLFNGKKGKEVPGVEGANRICKGVKGTIYVSTANNGLYRYSKEKKAFERMHPEGLPENTVIKSMRSDGKGKLSICTDGNGLLVYEESKGTVHQSSVRALDFDMTKANVDDALVDTDGNLWVAVYWKGIVVSTRLASNFEYIGHRSLNKNTIGTNCVTSICPASQGGIWVAADHQGLFLVNIDGTTSKHYDPAVMPTVPQTISSIHEDKSGNVWFGSSIGGLVCMNKATGSFSPFSAIHPDGAKVQNIFDICEDDSHCLWIASMGNGVFRYDPSTKSLINYHDNHSDEKFGILQNGWVYSIASKGNKLYVGSADGVNEFTIEKNGSLKNGKVHLSGCTISSISFAPDGSVWLATSHGVYSISKDGKYKNYTVNDGLCDNHICSVQIVEKNGKQTVWASTDNGLSHIDTQTGEINNFYLADGLQGNEFCANSSAQFNGTLYFGGINGLNYFVPENIEHNKETHELSFRIVDFYLFGAPVHVGQKSGVYDIISEWISEAKEVHLCNTDNTFSLELSTMSFASSHTAYEYSINDGEWISVGEGQNRISFNNMNPGKYHIHIRAVGYGKASEEKTITVIIHPAWYASPIAYIVYLLLLLIIGYFVYVQIKERIAARKILMTHRQEEELNEARIQFFMNISHEIRTPMTLILAPLEKLRSMDKDDEHQRNYRLIHQNAHRILRLINQLMDLRKIEKGQFQLTYQNVELVEFLDNLAEVFETTAQNRGIDFKFEHEGIPALNAMVDSSSLDKIVMNLLSNAFKFTPDGGAITMQLKQNIDGCFTIVVNDTGVGIPDADKQKVFKRFYSAKHQNGYIGTGIGLNLTALLVDLHKGDIKATDNPAGQGSSFVVNMPLAASADIQVIAETSTEASAEKKMEDNASDAITVSQPDTEGTTHADVETTALPIEANSTKHRNLLVVEDDSAIRQYIHSELSGDFTIHECGNGKEGWDYVQKNPEKVDLVISDIMMPVMEGTTLCQNVKTNFNTNHIPVILMSAKTTEADRIAGMSIGADAYITKPFNVELLRTTALSIVKQRQLLKGKFVTSMQKEGTIEQVKLTSPDEHLMERVLRVINENLDNPELNVEFISDKVGVSRVHFHRKIKELTGQTPRDFIKSIRLKEAARLLSEKHLDITDVSIATGFRSLSTFSTSFKDTYGKTPSEYMKEKIAK